MKLQLLYDYKIVMDYMQQTMGLFPLESDVSAATFYVLIGLIDNGVVLVDERPDVCLVV